MRVAILACLLVLGADPAMCWVGTPAQQGETGAKPGFALSDTSQVVGAYLGGRAQLTGEIPILTLCDQMPTQPGLSRRDVAELLDRRAIYRLEESCKHEGQVETDDGWKRRLIIVAVEIDSLSATIHSAIPTGPCAGVREIASLRGPSPWRLVRVSIEPAPTGDCIHITRPSQGETD